MKSRQGDTTTKTHFRTDRYYTVGADWYAAAREGNNIGPFRSRLEAQAAVVKYVAGLKDRRNPGAYARTVSNDCWANTNFI